MEKYYYIRDDEKTNPQHKGRPIITVCVVEMAGNIGRGIAICSDKDQPCKKIGKKIAKERATFALVFENHNLQIKLTHRVPSDIFHFGAFKSYFNPTLTEYEQKLFKRPTTIQKINDVSRKIIENMPHGGY